MKKELSILLAILLLLMVTACSGNPGGSSSSSIQSTGPIGGGLRLVTILFDFSNGSQEPVIREESYYSYADPDNEELIAELSQYSGLDFFATVSIEEGGRTVIDWAADSTLIAGLDDREQREDFFFYDADSLRWFMMDSIWRNFQGGEIYFTMDGGRELVFDELYPVSRFPSDEPYMGSAYYFARADEGGGLSEDEALDLLSAALEMAEGTAIVSYGAKTIDGVPCWTFAYGANTAEKFTAEERYAVTENGEILIYSIAENQYKAWTKP